MGRLKFTALRVHRNAASYLRAEGQSRLQRADDRGASPAWFDIVGMVPPAQVRLRTQPVQHQRRLPRNRTRKPSRMFVPQRIGYQEDGFREIFFRDHPWELARPRVVLEKDGQDNNMSDWSRLEQPRRPLSGESVVQRQKWLITNQPNTTEAQAYDQARKEFYETRLLQDVELKVAKEEALLSGAFFGPTALEVGMQMEDKAFENWRKRAVKEASARRMLRESFYTSTDDDNDDAVDDDSGGDALDKSRTAISS